MTGCTGATGETGTRYTYSQLMGLWINNGGPKSVAALAAAIAEAESGGCSAAVNPTDNDGTQTSWGLWQISNGTHGQPVPSILTPGINAQQAVAKYNGAGHTFSPWGTYTSGAYKAYLSPGTTPDTGVQSLGAPAAPGTSAGGGGAADCWLGLPSIDLGITSTPELCLVQRSSARGLIGGALLLGGGLVLLLGAGLLAAYGLKSAGAGKAAGKTLEAAGAVAAVAGAPEVGAPVAAAGARTQRAASTRPSRARSSRPAPTKSNQTLAT
jgi:hypothetical protein